MANQNGSTRRALDYSPRVGTAIIATIRPFSKVSPSELYTTLYE